MQLIRSGDESCTWNANKPRADYETINYINVYHPIGKSASFPCAAAEIKIQFNCYGVSIRHKL